MLGSVIAKAISSGKIKRFKSDGDAARTAKAAGNTIKGRRGFALRIVSKALAARRKSGAKSKDKEVKSPERNRRDTPDSNATWVAKSQQRRQGGYSARPVKKLIVQ